MANTDKLRFQLESMRDTLTSALKDLNSTPLAPKRHRRTQAELLQAGAISRPRRRPAKSGEVKAVAA